MLGYLLEFQPMKHECQKTKDRDDKAAQLKVSLQARGVIGACIERIEIYHNPCNL